LIWRFLGIEAKSHNQYSCTACFAFCLFVALLFLLQVVFSAQFACPSVLVTAVELVVVAVIVGVVVVEVLGVVFVIVSVALVVIGVVIEIALVIELVEFVVFVQRFPLQVFSLLQVGM